MDQHPDPFGQISVSPQKLEPDSASESRVFKSVLYYCALVFGGPIIAFFATKYLLLSPIFAWSSNDTKTDVTSAVVAIIFLHFALGLYIMKAYFADDGDSKRKLGKRD